MKSKILVFGISVLTATLISEENLIKIVVFLLLWVIGSFGRIAYLKNTEKELTTWSIVLSSVTSLTVAISVYLYYHAQGQIPEKLWMISLSAAFGEVIMTTIFNSGGSWIKTYVDKYINTKKDD